MAAYYVDVDVHAALAFDPVVKVNKLYVASLTEPLQVLTPPLELVTPLESDEPFALLRPMGRFAEFLKTVEARVLEMCVQHKVEWFRKDVDDDALRTNFKSFFREDGSFKVKTVDVAVFGADKGPVGPEEATAGKTVRCVLELTRICFGRQEFGAMWRLSQARVVEIPRCLIEDSDVDEEEEEDGDGGDAEPGGDIEEQEFL